MLGEGGEKSFGEDFIHCTWRGRGMPCLIYRPSATIYLATPLPFR